MATTDWVNKYMQAYEPSIQRETNRADAQMASRGLFRSTAGAGYTDARRSDLMGQAYKEALTTGEAARKADMENLRSQERNVSEALNTQYGYTLGQRELAEDPKYNVKISPALQKILDRYYKNMGDAKESWGGGEGADWLAVKGTDNRGARANRSLDIQEQDLLAKQRLEAAANALAEKSMRSEQDALAWDRDPKNILVGAMMNEMASAGAVDPETGEPIERANTKQWEALYQSLMGRNLAYDVQDGDVFALAVADYLGRSRNDYTPQPWYRTMHEPTVAPPVLPEPTFPSRVGGAIAAPVTGAYNLGRRLGNSGFSLNPLTMIRDGGAVSGQVRQSTTPAFLQRHL